MNYEYLLPFCNESQAERLKSVSEIGYKATCRKYKISPGTLGSLVERLKAKAATRGLAPECDMTREVPDPYVVRGTSTLYKADGSISQQWVKTQLDEKKYFDAIKASVEALSEDIKPVKPKPAPRLCTSDLLTQYTLTDYHIGMKSWGEETGADWDLEIAENLLSDMFGEMVRAAPHSETGLFCQLGDFIHLDSIQALTPSSGHLLDADSRYEKIVKTAVRVARNAIDLMLTKHQKVVVLMAEGNHDLSSSIWLRHLFSLLYENEPRVSVIDSPFPYYAYQHGETMLAFHHGHLSKNQQLPMLFATQFAKLWGDTTKRYCHTGHRHHTEEKDHGGMTVIQHTTLAARDAYAARGGWSSDRSISSITYSKRFGQVARTTFVPEMLGG